MARGSTEAHSCKEGAFSKPLPSQKEGETLPSEQRRALRSSSLRRGNSSEHAAAPRRAAACRECLQRKVQVSGVEILNNTPHALNPTP